MWCSEEDDDDSARRSWDKGTPPIEKTSTPLREGRGGEHVAGRVINSAKCAHRSIIQDSMVLSQVQPKQLSPFFFIEILFSCSNTGDRQ